MAHGCDVINTDWLINKCPRPLSIRCALQNLEKCFQRVFKGASNNVLLIKVISLIPKENISLVTDMFMMMYTYLQSLIPATIM